MANGRYAKRGAFADPADWASPRTPNVKPSRLPVRLPGPKTPSSPFRVPGRLPNDVFRRVQRVPDFGVGPRYTVPRLPRLRVPWYAPFILWELIDVVDRIVKHPIGVVPSGLKNYATLKCLASPEFLPPQYPDVTHWGVRSGHVNASDCGLGEQAWSDAISLSAVGGPYLEAAGQRTNIILEQKIPPIDPNNKYTWRFRYHSVWWFDIPSGGVFNDLDGVGARFHVVPFTIAPVNEVDPNLLRTLPSNPLGDPNEAYRFEPEAAPLEVPLPDRLWDSMWQYVFPGSVTPRSPFSETPIDDWQQGSVEFSPNNAPRLNVSRAVNKRPGRRKRERKVRSRTLRILDVISESAEVVDAVYQALPWKVRQRWEKEHQGGHWAKVKGKWKWLLDRNRHPLLDNAGQYGIAGADWKARALYHNLDKLDVTQATRNVIKNALEDAFLGEIYRRLPPQIGHVGEDAFIKLDEWFDTGMDEVLDGIMYDDTVDSILGA